MNILIFGDQTADQFPLLRKITARKDNALLTTFIERSAHALRDEVKRLPRSQRDAIPPFLTMTHLVEVYYENGVKVPQLESVMTTFSQLAHFIGYFSENPSELPVPANTRVLGLCTGLLAASAVACAKSLNDLLPLAVEAVRIAFRTGAVTGLTKDAIDSQSTESWSTIVANTSEQTAKTALAEFHSENGIALPSQAYVSAVSVMAITISGPPSTTKRLFKESEAFNKNHKVPIPVFAPYHAEHLYGKTEMEKILDEETRELLASFRPTCLIHSASTGKPHTATNALELVELILGEILRDPVRWDHLLEETVSEVTAFSKSECNIHAIGVTNVANSLVSALKAGGQSAVAVKDHSIWAAKVEEAKGRTQNDKIAIVGMAGRFPNSANHEKLWELLEKGLDVHREIPADRFDAKAHVDPSGKGKNKSHSPYGCFIDEPGLFDPRFFNMSPREAAQTDPMGRLALVTAYEALEMSGYVPNRTQSTKLHRVGTFYGQTSDDWREINAAQNVDTYFITGGVRAFAPGRINYYFKFSGPSYSIDTACSSSLAAIQLACTSLWAGDCDTACAGGLNVLTNPDIFAGLSKGQFLSKTGSCKTYDNNADGYCRGDACGTVILKRYEDAISDKDNILGCILGAATNHSAEAVSITHPHAGAQEFLYKSVLANAGIDVHQIDYCEMHGTGTQAGDGIEMTSVTNALAPRSRQRRQDQQLYLGAIKANIGHAEAASGINSLVKVMLMFKNNAIPANVGIKTERNKTFPKDLEDRMVNIPTAQTPFLRKGAEPRRVLLNNFSAAGGNTALVIEDGPLREAPTAIDPRGTQLITVSARGIASLKKQISNLSDYLEENPKTTLTNLAYTLNARRIQHNYRVAFTVSDIEKVRDGLQAQVKESYSPIAMVPTKTAFTFTGQGSQYQALGKKLFEDLPSFKLDIEQLDNLVRMQDLPSFIPLIDGTDITTLSPVVVQLGMACIQVALARMWGSWGIKPTAVIGHSLGEYAALHVAGVISAADMILLVGRRAQLLVADCTAYTHGMLAVKGSANAIREVLGDKMTEIACINGPEETVLCGTVEVVGTACDTLASKGFKATKLNVPFAFHSAQVDPILESFKKAASAVVFNKPIVPVLSPLTGETITEAGIIGPDYLARHARETVNFWTALTTGREDKLYDEKTAWVEVGAHPVCSGMVKSSLGGAPVTAPSLRRNEDPWKTITTSLQTLYMAGVYIDFNEYHLQFNDAQELLTLPTYAFDNKKYWLDYTNNWTLTKGEAPQVQRQIVAAPAEESTAEKKIITNFKSTTSCQKVVAEELYANSGTITVQTDLTQPQLYKAVTGHMVNDAPLCPSSLYADMAMTVADYLYKQLRPNGGEIGMNVGSMEVTKTLIAQMPPPAEGQHIQVEATADLDENTCHLKFRSVTPEGKELILHSTGIVKYEDVESWKEEWGRTQYMVQSQIDLLQAKLQTGAAHKVLRGMAYKLFKALVTYDAPYRGMEEVVLDGKQTEATAKIRFQTTPSDGDYYCSPFWIDSCAHISGFIVNASDLVDSENSVYISHGWKEMKLSKRLQPDGEYYNYVRMRPQPGNVSAGDVYIMEGEEIIGMVYGLKFQNIPRRALQVMLPSAKKTAGKPVAAAPRPAAPAKAAAPSPVKAAPVTEKKAPKTAKPAKAPKASKAPKTAGGVSSKVMKIIAEETDVDASELVDEAAFENLGVDSLMSLTISAKFREDLDLEISSTLFTDYPTVGAMKKYFSQFDGAAPAQEEAEDDSDDESAEASDVQTPYPEETSTPPSSAPSESGDKVTDDDLKPVPVRSTGDGPSLARRIVAEEMGVDVSEITDKAELSEMGMDSLMSLTILGVLREQTGKDLPSSFLSDNNTIEEIEKALGMSPQPQKAPATKAKQPQLAEVSAKLQAMQKDLSKYPNATSVLLQGNAKTATKKLFLLPDGSGSSTSYMVIPNIAPTVAVYGLNCPFMKIPDQWDCGIDGVAALYIKEIKRRQPQGPYVIGGWSAGGVTAYEATQQLIASGEKVEKLIFLDAPSPMTAKEPLPPRFHKFMDEIGLLGGGSGKGPSWLVPHFGAAVKALGQYEAQPMPADKTPQVYAIWAKEGICGKPTDPKLPPGEGDESKPMQWLLNNRTDFSHNGWGELMPAKNMTFATCDGNHFSMLREQYGDQLASLLKKGLGA